MSETKKKNMRYEQVSHVDEVLTEYFKEHYEPLKLTYSDMYEEIAEYCGVSSSTISQLKLKAKGKLKSAPSYIVAVKIAEFVGKPVTDILEIVESEEYASIEKKTCLISDCDMMATTKGYCLKHVHNARKK